MSAFLKTATVVVNNITDITIRNRFQDDHIECVNAVVTVEGGETFDLPLYWIGVEGVAALEYWETDKAKSVLVSLFENFIEIERDTVFECNEDPSIITNNKRNTIKLFSHFNIPSNIGY